MSTLPTDRGRACGTLPLSEPAMPVTIPAAGMGAFKAKRPESELLRGGTAATRSRSNACAVVEILVDEIDRGHPRELLIGPGAGRQLLRRAALCFRWGFLLFVLVGSRVGNAEIPATTRASNLLSPHTVSDLKDAAADQVWTDYRNRHVLPGL